VSRRSDTSDPAIDEPAGDETVVAVPRPKNKKFLPSDSAIKTAIYRPERHGEQPQTIPEGTDQVALSQPDLTDTTVAVPEDATGLTTDPSQRARVLEVHGKADKLLAELDATAKIKLGATRRPNTDEPTDPEEIYEITVDPIAPTVEPTAPITEDDEDDDDSLDDEPETVVNASAQKRPGYPTPMPSVPNHTPQPGSITSTRPGVAATPPPGGVVPHHPLAADEPDDAAGIATIETGWSPNQPPTTNLAPVAPRPMPPVPQRRTVGSVLLAPFRAIAGWFKPAQPQLPPSQQRQRQQIPDGLSNINNQTYTEVNRMVQRRRKGPTSAPPPSSGRPGGDGGETS
jgi:hypothetical protein